MSRIVQSPQSIIQNFLLFQKDTLSFLMHALPLGDVVFFKTGNLKPSYVIQSPDFIQEILVAKDDFFRKGRSTNVLRRTIGDGLLTSEAGEHQRQKGLMLPVFYKERIQQYGEIMIDETINMMNRWQNGQMIYINEEMMKLTLAIITRTMFGEDISEERKSEVAHAVSETIARSAQLLYSPIMTPFYMPTRGNLKHKKALRSLDSLVDDVLRRYDENPESYKLSMVGLLSEVRDDTGNPLPRKEIRDQMVTMLIAGHETTANALSWAWYVLSQNQTHVKRIADEYHSLQAQDLTATEMYRALKYTQKCVQETLRLYPPAWLILREVVEDVEILGENFVKGSSLLISPYSLHRNEQVFERPLEFDPNRFADGRSYPRFSYFPFGGGSRSCIGSTFAMMEATLILANMASKINLELVAGQHAIPETSVSLRMKEDLKMLVRK
jgi:cytochrome P450